MIMIDKTNNCDFNQPVGNFSSTLLPAASSAEAVACKDVYDLFIKLIDPDPNSNAGNIVATPVSWHRFLERFIALGC